MAQIILLSRVVHQVLNAHWNTHTRFPLNYICKSLDIKEKKLKLMNQCTQWYGVNYSIINEVLSIPLTA